MTEVQRANSGCFVIAVRAAQEQTVRATLGGPMGTIFLVFAAVLFSLGGLLMKLSAGLTRPLPTAGFLMLFVAGAILQTLGMRRTDLSVAYIFVLGLEAALTVLLSVLYLRESLPPQRLAAIILVIAGIAWLRLG